MSSTCPQAAASTSLWIKSNESWPIQGFFSERAYIYTRPRALLCLYVGLWSSEGTYCTQSGLLEMPSPHLLPIGRGAARTHASQWPRRRASSQGRPTALTSPRWPAFSATQCDWLRWVSKHFHMRKHTLTGTHTLGFYRRDPPRSTCMRCYCLEVAH